jgi:adenosine 3'-phospho 5'-phosphosulfate transporter B3
MHTNVRGGDGGGNGGGRNNNDLNDENADQKVALMSNNNNYSDTTTTTTVGSVNIDVASNSSSNSSSAGAAEAQQQQQQQRVKFLCLDITRSSRAVKFCLLSAGVWFFFMSCSYIEEYLFRFLPDFEFGWYLTFFELVCFSSFAAMERATTESVPLFSRVAKLRSHALVGLAMTISRGLTNWSLQYLNYPTQVIFKSMKLITVLIGSVFVTGRRYNRYQTSAVFALVVAAIMFGLGDVDTTPSYNYKGIVIVLVSLVADAAHANTQDALMSRQNVPVREVMLFTNMTAAVCALVVVTCSGELWLALSYCNENPIAYALFITRSVVVYCGVLCYVTLVQQFGVVLATTMTTVRKILTILFSFVMFSHVFTIKYVYGVMLFAVSIALNFRGHSLAERQRTARSSD